MLRAMPDSPPAVATGPLAELVRRTWFLEDELLLLRALVPRGSVCLDVGAANGIYTALLARLVGPRGAVHAIEPQPFALRNLRAVRALLRSRQVTLHQLALADRHGELRLVVPRRLLQVHGRAYLWDADADPHVYTDEFRGVDDLTVPTTTLDALVEELDLPSLAFVKVDVEGAELRLLHGAAATIARHRPALLIEVEDRHTQKYGHTAAEVFGWFADRDYRAEALISGSLRDVTGTVPGVRNYLFRPA